MVRTAGETETTIVSAERIQEYSQLPQEAEIRTEEDNNLPDGWPLLGKVKLDGYSTKYRPDLDEVNIQQSSIYLYGRINRNNLSILST